MRQDVRHTRKRDTLTLQFPYEQVTAIDERLEAVIETWKKVGNMDLSELLRSCYFQGLMDGSGIETNEKARQILVATVAP